MRYFKFLLFSLITLTPALAHSQAVDSVLTLRQCIDIALKHNLDVRKSELILQSARVDKNQAKENLLPTLNAQVDHGINNGRSVNLVDYSYVNASTKFASYNANADLTLFNGLQNLNRIKQTSLAYKAGEMDLQQAKDLVTINTITAYLQVLNNTEALSQVQNQIAVSKKQLDRLQILENQGANKQPNDFTDLKGTYADNQVSYVNQKATLQTSKLNLLQILNIPYRPDIVFEKISNADIFQQTGTSEDVYQTALNQLAYVKAAILRRQSAEKGVSAARGALSPTVSLFAGLNTNYSSATTLNDGSNATIPYGNQLKTNFNNNFGVSVRIPILNYFQNRNKVTLAKIDLQSYKYVEENTKIQLRQNVEQAYLNMSNALERYKALQDQVAAYKESFRIAEIRFNAGVLNSVEFVLSKNYLDRANLNLINARYDCFIYNKILDYYQGRLAL
ncbi:MULTISPECIES: TolC family protein [unclassified Mucilaginibacter]|uniref:TolC family protein n=1 Tax=unclassified Mucilaginibacter TaxID=2617802 RepID=UPI002AC97370|nr:MULTISPECIES: TolC family protein [unclassified Mucilaginibacter]MEB0262322.1 TolC family protein [Mucilaginibacter sp. 10I4]MEB0279969.1 TolC family protein [Mucilaginibacter sp. 10B2]MEB0301789.1 TolC family protein [Mucilaginibacter sp. 5C4]WPX21927.1 TolC family protein [Mucilaginibacter sp. 5C4]